MRETRSQPTVLVVDDTAANRYAVVKYLRHAGFEVLEATTGEEALGLAERQPDLIILDVRLPDMLGYDVCRQVKQNPTTADIPVLHISATFKMSEDKVKGLESGADGYLTGPVEPEELLANVKLLLRLKEAQNSLRRTNARLTSVLASIADAFFALDDHWQFTALNPVAEENIFRRPASELLGKVIWEEFPEANRLECFQKFQQVLGEQRPVHFEGQLGSTDRWFEAHAYPHGREVEIYLRDITTRKQAEQALADRECELRKWALELEARVQQRTAELQDTVHELESLTYSITHDLRAPLRAMHGFATVLLDDYGVKLDAEGLEHLNRIINAAGRLDLLIADVLNYGAIVRAEVVLAPVDLGKLVHDVSREYPGFQWPDAVIKVRSPLPPLLASEALLTQCLSNLLTNAVKFVRPGTKPEIEIWAENKGEFVRVWIGDNGIGIAPQHRERIFHMFERLHAPHEYSGTGIGLAIVRKAVERMGGRLGLESTLGQGSRFWLELRAA